MKKASTDPFSKKGIKKKLLYLGLFLFLFFLGFGFSVKVQVKAQVRPEKDMLDSSLERIIRKLSCHKKGNIIGLNKIVLIQENRIGLNVIFYQEEKFFCVILNDPKIELIREEIELSQACLSLGPGSPDLIKSCHWVYATTSLFLLARN